MTNASFQLQGVEDLKRTLAELGGESATKVGQTATREAAKMVKDALVASAPVGTEPTRKTRRNKRGRSIEYDYGHLRDNILVRKLKAVRQHQIRYGVGVGKAFWGIFSEFGTAHQPANPWMRPAFDSIAGVVVESVGRLLGVGLAREARRLRRRSKKG